MACVVFYQHGLRTYIVWHAVLSVINSLWEPGIRHIQQFSILLEVMERKVLGIIRAGSNWTTIQTFCTQTLHPDYHRVPTVNPTLSPLYLGIRFGYCSSKQRPFSVRGGETWQMKVRRWQVQGMGNTNLFCVWPTSELISWSANLDHEYNWKQITRQEYNMNEKCNNGKYFRRDVWPLLQFAAE
jgi:hypothetical protein